MPSITVRARTSQKAMEEILLRLGPDALILSTRKVDGQYEIHASGDGPDPLDRTAPEDADIPAEAAQSPLAQSPLAESPLSRPRPVATPANPAPRAEPPLSRFDRAFRDLADRPSFRDPAFRDPAFRDTSGRPQPRPRPNGPAQPQDALADLGRRLLFAEGLTEPLPPRTVIIGPPGAGKSLLAARLAARFLQTDPRLQPRLIAPTAHLPLCEDRLRGWARLLGLRLDRPSLAEALATPDAADPAFPQVFDLSDTADRMPDLAARLIDSDDAELILCLPTGMNPALTARLCRDWQAWSPNVCLTRLDLWEPDLPELHAIADAGLRLSHVATGTGLLGAVRRPGLADLRHWAGAWAAQQGIAAE